MPRCQMCDHSDELPSIYESSLADSEKPGRVQYYPHLDMELCWRCLRVSAPIELEHPLSFEMVDKEWDEMFEVDPVLDIERAEDDLEKET